MNLGIRSPMRRSPPAVIGSPIEDSSDGTQPGAAGSAVINPFNSYAAGTPMLIVVFQPGAAKLVSSGSDDAGNTWHVDSTFAANNVGLSFVSCTLANPITFLTNITLNFAPATLGSSWAYWILEVDGIVAGARDKTANGSGAAATSGATGSTAALSSANQIVFGLIGLNGSSGGFTKGASYSIAGITPSPSNRALLEWKIVAATTGVLADCTWVTSRSYAALVATYAGA